MKRYVSAALAGLFIVGVALVQTVSAQDRERLPGDRGTLPGTTPGQWNPEAVRSELLALTQEADQTFRFLSDYSIVRKALDNSTVDGLDSLMARNREVRSQISSLSVNDLALYSLSFTEDDSVIRRLRGIARKMRTDPAYLRVLKLLESSDLTTRASAAPAVDHSGQISSKERTQFQTPSCDWYSLTDFPSAADFAIANGILIALDTTIKSLDETTVKENVPNPAYFIPVGLRTVDAAVQLDLEIKREAGTWCQDMAFNIQGGLTSDGEEFTAHIIFKFDKGYAEFTQSLVRALYDQARGAGIKTTCVATPLNQGDEFLANGKLLDAYKKYRQAYQAIGAEDPEGGVCPQ